MDHAPVKGKLPVDLRLGQHGLEFRALLGRDAAHAQLVGVDEHTALVRDPVGVWRVVGEGAVTLYQGRDAARFPAGSTLGALEGT